MLGLGRCCGQFLLRNQAFVDCDFSGKASSLTAHHGASGRVATGLVELDHLIGVGKIVGSAIDYPVYVMAVDAAKLFDVLLMELARNGEALESDSLRIGEVAILASLKAAQELDTGDIRAARRVPNGRSAACPAGERLEHFGVRHVEGLLEGGYDYLTAAPVDVLILVAKVIGLLEQFLPRFFVHRRPYLLLSC